jgi:hypothetical protein
MIGVKNMYLTKYQFNEKVLGSIIPNPNTKGSTDFTKRNKISLESKRQAFKKASDLLFFNDDMTNFVTLTYRKQHKNYSMVLDDLKNLSRSEKNFKYIAVVERHKTGCYHIHLITSVLATVSLRSGFCSAVHWKKGFSDVRSIRSFDENFNIFKYLFKYLAKADKIGGRWVLKSRNLNKPFVSHKQLDLNQTFKYLDFLQSNKYHIDKLEIKDYYFRDTIIFKFNN